MENFCDLTGKVAIVTGASSGIGKASAIALAAQGAKVTLAARRISELEQLAQEIKTLGSDALAIKTDVLAKEQIEAMVNQTVQKWGRIDILLNNAGIAEFKQFFQMTEQDWDKTLDINLKGYFLTAQAAAKIMVKRKSGRIINIASIAMGGIGVGFPSITHYCASKGGIVALTEALADELAPYNILVNSISPGIIETDMTKKILENPESKNASLSRIPLKRPGKPEEIANMVVFLASNQSSYITGANFVVDGGYLAA